jgi:hypothetical protein
MPREAAPSFTFSCCRRRSPSHNTPPFRFLVSEIHLAFAEEKESRLVLFHSRETLQHRVRGSLLIPYLEIEVGPQFESLVEEVIVGP